jgi:hypothetical protein
MRLPRRIRLLKAMNRNPIGEEGVVPLNEEIPILKNKR